MIAPTFDLERARLVAARRLRPENFDEFQRLAKSIVHGPPFQLVFIDCTDDRYRDTVIECLGEVLQHAGLRSAQLRLNERVHDAASLEERLQRQVSKAEAVHIVGGIRWFNQSRWDDLNQRRERLARDARCRLIFWLDKKAIESLSRYGQDLWAWRSGVYAFESVSPSSSLLDFRPISRPRPGDPDLRSMADRHRRVVALRQILAADLPPSADLRVPLLDELGRLLYDLGEYDAALSHWRELELPLHRERNDERAQAITMGQIADVLEARGEFDEALRIRREEQLPVYRRLGDQLGYAITMGKVADVLEWLGKVDEALVIRREQELPIYEKLGDERARAATLGQIARVLQDQGDLDQALHIWREQEIPVYERLGDLRARAVAMGNVADVMQVRGELEEALRIRREEQLPVYERLGDQRARAVTMGKIASVLRLRGQHDEAIRIRREEELPVLERLRDRRGMIIGRANLAVGLHSRGAPGDLAEARLLLETALSEAKELRLPEEKFVSDLLAKLDEV